MARIQVIAKATGVHAMSGLNLTAENRYEIEEEHFGDEVFDPASASIAGQPAPIDAQKEKN